MPCLSRSSSLRCAKAAPRLGLQFPVCWTSAMVDEASTFSSYPVFAHKAFYVIATRLDSGLSPTVQSSAPIWPPFLQAVRWLSGNMCPACAHVTLTAAQATPTSKHILATVSDKLGKAIATGCPEILSHKADSTLSASQQVAQASTRRALHRLTSEVERDPVHSVRFGRQRIQCNDKPRGTKTSQFGTRNPHSYAIC